MQPKTLPFLNTNRLLLRQLQLNDDKVIFVLRNNEQVNEFIQRPLLNHISDARHFIKAINEGIASNDWLYWAMILKSKQQLIGTICLWHFSHEHATAEIGYELHPQFQGMGLMNEAMQAIINYGFTTLQLTTIEAFTQPDNIRSTKLLVKNNFIRDTANNYTGSGREVRFVLHQSTP